MKYLITFLMLSLLVTANASDKLKMNYKNKDILEVIENYSKETNQKFIIDPNVKGKITIFIPGEISYEEAFENLSSALASNGYGILKQGETMLVRSARKIQRDSLEVSTKLPTIKPERMFTWIYQVENLNSNDIINRLRILSSQDGEIAQVESTNQLIITDWTSSLSRIATILKIVDVKVDSSKTKVTENQNRKDHIKK